MPHPASIVSLANLSVQPDLVDRAYRALRDAIVGGSLAPGCRLTQEDIARRLDVSRQPVLQALRQLKADGLVLDAPGRGVQVTRLDADILGGVYQVRSALDVLAARLAARRCARIDPCCVADGRRALHDRDVQALIDADAAFHDAIYAASGNPLIGQSAHVHWHHIRRAMGAVLQRNALRTAVWDEHEAIAVAIANGDEDTAGGLIARHDERAAAYIAAQLAAASDAAGAARNLPAPSTTHRTRRQR